MTKKRFTRVLITFSIAMAMVLSSAAASFACTGIYFGKDVTDNGTIISGRSEDANRTLYKKTYTVRSATMHNPGDMYVGTGGFTVPYPAKTLRYTMVKDFTGDGEEEMAQAGTNEKGVSVSGTVTINDSALATISIDPLVSNGLREEDVPSVVLMQAETAREGAQLLVDIYQNIGAGGSRDMTIVSDKKESWFVQSLSGHNAVAVKAPDDMVGLSPNITANVKIGDEKNTIVSKNIVKTAKEAGTFEQSANGQTLIAESYASKPSSISNRLWQGYYYLGGEQLADKNATADYIDLFKAPRKEKNYTLYEALRLLAYRGEGTNRYGDDGEGNGDGIGNDNTLEAHVFEARPNMPTELSMVQWLSLTPPEFNVYIPGYNALITDTIEENKIGLDTMTYDSVNLDANSYRTTLYELYFLCKGKDNIDGLAVGSLAARTKYGSGVKLFWEKYQKELIAKQKVIDQDMLKILAYSPQLAQEKATALNMHLQKEALGYAKQMIAELNAYMKNNKGEEAFIPSALKSGKLPTYNFAAVGGTGLPKISISSSSISAIKAQIYSGKAKVPAVKVTLKGKVLAKNKDYTVAYANNKNIGKSTVTITGKGDYTGKKAVTFNILPKKMATPTITVSKKKATIKWKKIPSNITKYQIQYKQSGAKTWKSKTVTGSKSSLTIKSLKKGKKYQVRIRACKTVSKANYYGAWSNVRTSNKVK